MLWPLELAPSTDRPRGCTRGGLLTTARANRLELVVTRERYEPFNSQPRGLDVARVPGRFECAHAGAQSRIAHVLAYLGGLEPDQFVECNFQHLGQLRRFLQLRRVTATLVFR